MSHPRTILVVASSEAAANAKVKRGYGAPVYTHLFERKCVGLPRGLWLYEVTFIEEAR